MAWRMYLIRREIRTYYDELREKFQGVNDDPNFGSKIAWPKATPLLAKADEMLKKVYKNWWARKLVGSLSEEQQRVMRIQLLAYRFLAGRKQGFKLRRDAYPGHHTDGDGPRQGFENTHGAAVFDAPIVKLSRKGKPME